MSSYTYAKTMLKNAEERRRRLDLLNDRCEMRRDASRRESPLTQAQYEFLESQLLKDLPEVKAFAAAFGITQQNVTEYVRRHLELLPDVYTSLIQAHPAFSRDRDRTLNTLWDLWLPLATRLADRQKARSRPFVQGILGGQGAGKTTLAIALKILLARMGLSCIGISLDDLYKTHAEREELQRQDPRLIWRGPPGTHDIDLGIQVLDRLRQGLGQAQGAVPTTTPTPEDQQPPIFIPRFDKSKYGGDGDRAEPEAITGADIILFEGWFTGVQPVDPAIFATAPEPIITEADRQFAISTNERLKAYLPLWQRLDSLMLLYPSDYRYSKLWRLQAEHETIAKGGDGMSDEDVEKFVEYFWRALHPELFITPLMRSPDLCDLVVEINIEHQPERIYAPRDRRSRSNK
ncbi:zeta toxin family protein [Pseudanabaena sp. PCC 6802]|uniref:zeta toxin family protein n=1 Tax=Pseudanabaena sp. PCC 6802 TaxID=118173 RepID=UPI00034A7C7B|nr:zeta toxin family protein [Pseudanabaena sp. PCC 6802]